MRNKSLFLVVVITFLFAGQLLAGDYVGVKKCKMCHNKPAKGAQYKKWASTAHAKALETLHSEKSAAIAKKKGLKVPAYEAPECLSCHVTGWDQGGYVLNPGDEKAAKLNENLAGVTCEACHGPGKKYKSKKVMEAVWKGETKPAEVGLTWKPTKETCVVCHNENSPTYKEFDFDKRVKEVGHAYPKEMKNKK